MPNWCYNHVEISGKKENIELILTKISMIEEKQESVLKEGVFETLIGRDENISKEDYNNQGWYDHNISRYGTKWDVNKEDWMINQSIEVDGETATISTSFDTAWSPPIPFFTTLSEMYGVVCTMESEESGNDFFCKIVIEEGMICEDSTYTYEEGVYRFQDDYFWNDYLSCQFEYLFDEGNGLRSDISELKSRFDFCEPEEIDKIVGYYRVHHKDAKKLERNEKAKEKRAQLKTEAI